MHADYTDRESITKIVRNSQRAKGRMHAQQVESADAAWGPGMGELGLVGVGSVMEQMCVRQTQVQGTITKHRERGWRIEINTFY